MNVDSTQTAAFLLVSCFNVVTNVWRSLSHVVHVHLGT